MMNYPKYRQAINSEIDKIAIQILSEKLNKRTISQMVNDAVKRLKISTEQFLKYLELRASDTMKKGSIATAKALAKMADTRVSNLYELTEDDISSLVKKLMSGSQVGVKIVKGKEVLYEWGIEKSIWKLVDTFGKDIRSHVLAGYISGDTPAQIIQNLKNSHLKNKIDRHTKVLIKHIIHQAGVDADMEVYSQNEKYFYAYEYRTMQDARVETECRHLEGKTWIIGEVIPKDETPLRHIGCRCSIDAISKEEYDNPNRVNNRKAKHLVEIFKDKRKRGG